jgi:hypothetical protein
MSGINFLIGYRTDKYVILASDKSAFAFGALRVTDSKFIFTDKHLIISHS